VRMYLSSILRERERERERKRKKKREREKGCREDTADRKIIPVFNWLD